ncbi:VapE domain-containing protein [Flavobacterium filum]|uniref:VapE domain-containing protein n=1 Tax=Flavobacterium filum TaxID=370974 RepID=UPI0023F1E467|nr:VapE domain-containing protein [Flavobacterium filum]
MEEIENEKLLIKIDTKSEKIDENTPQIIKIEKFITTNYEIRIDIVMNVLESRKKNSNDNFEKDEQFENNLIVDLLRAGYKSVNQTVRSLLASNFVPKYHPIKEYFKTLKKWDGIDRIVELCNCLDCDLNERQALNTNFKKHLIRCVASVFVPKYFNKHCFVLIGTKQSMGKTSFIRYLMPKVLERYITDAVGDWKDKDANIALGSNFIINLDELANLDKNETNSLKATLSRNSIKVRRPYDRIESEIPRLANFFGSTNDLQFLTDLTGNVRWVCFRIYGINFKYNKIDINQLWAQAFHEFKNEFQYELTKDELKENDIRNELFMIANEEVETIQKFFIPGKKDVENIELGGLPKFAQSSELRKIINNKSYNFRSEKKFGQALVKLGFSKSSERMKTSKNPVYGYWYHEIYQE